MWRPRFPRARTRYEAILVSAGDFNLVTQDVRHGQNRGQQWDHFELCHEPNGVRARRIWERQSWLVQILRFWERMRRFEIVGHIGSNEGMVLGYVRKIIVCACWDMREYGWLMLSVWDFNLVTWNVRHGQNRRQQGDHFEPCYKEIHPRTGRIWDWEDVRDWGWVCKISTWWPRMWDIIYLKYTMLAGWGFGQVRLFSTFGASVSRLSAINIAWYLLLNIGT